MLLISQKKEILFGKMSISDGAFHIRPVKDKDYECKNRLSDRNRNCRDQRHIRVVSRAGPGLRRNYFRRSISYDEGQYSPGGNGFAGNSPEPNRSPLVRSPWRWSNWASAGFG
jgi:hypothetical protein